MTVDDNEAGSGIEVPRAGQDLPIAALSSDEIVEASPTVSIRDAAEIMRNEGIGLLVLRDGNGIAGVVSERDILHAVAEGIESSKPVHAIGNGHTIQRATPTSTVGDVAKEMMENYVRHILIIGSDGEPSGIVSIRDLLAVIASD